MKTAAMIIHKTRALDERLSWILTLREIQTLPAIIPYR